MSFVYIVGNDAQKIRKTLERDGFNIQDLEEESEESIACCVSERKKENNPIAYNPNDMLWNYT